MGRYLRVAKQFVCHYGSQAHFNWGCECFHDFLRAVGIQVCGEQWNEDAEDFEICKCDWDDGIEKLKDFESLPDEQKEEIQEALAQLETNLPEMIEIMEAYKAEADPKWDYLEFSFF